MEKAQGGEGRGKQVGGGKVDEKGERVGERKEL